MANGSVLIVEGRAQVVNYFSFASFFMQSLAIDESHPLLWRIRIELFF